MDDPTQIPLKRCCHCKQFFPSTPEFFRKERSLTDGLNRRCKTCCIAFYRSKHPLKTIPLPPAPDGYKRCPGCKRILPATTEYYQRNAAAFGKYKLSARCKDCICLTDRHRIPQGHKRCRDCKKIFPATRDYFVVSPTEKYGLGGQCSECRKKLNEKRAYSGIYPSEGSTKDCSTCHKSLPATLEYFQSDASKPDHLCSRCKECANAGRRTDEARVAIRVVARNRKARKKALPGKLTTQDIQDQHRRQKDKCYYCRKPLNGIYEIDHIVPITREGSSNEKWNIVLACTHCNSSKRNRLPHEWPEGGRLL